ncbi:hypothetical protein QWT69_15210 [Sporosarcina oncorhynchi]|uniref:ABC transporter permease n=1 Tax=Sporosarcina oncorhynchi TaxID=3056444 RepID=A0ABZ0L3X4_9BACL|nr:hypothetical protein [Sporosarcina sp. T2O-4]WOV87188.1 hypothetical protein QWT69_15210 [Sporosarcina sp. T2O-4]
MNKVIGFVSKGIVKSKYMIFIPVAIAVLVSMLLLINATRPDTTQEELQESIDDRVATINDLIGKILNKKRQVGLPEDQQNALDSLLLQEEYLKLISQNIAEDNLNIAGNLLAYIDEYKDYKKYNIIEYYNYDILEIERKKAEALFKHQLSFTEQKNPYKTALFSKQLFQFLFNPITAFLFFLIFSYKYRADEENGTFDFFKVNSLSNPAVYYGYLVSIYMYLLVYIFIATTLSMLPPILTGNLKTIYYPIEVIVGAETLMVPVWKWLIFLPLGWGIFVSLLLLMAAVFFKQKLPVGILMAVLLIPLAIAYIISNQFGFHMMNPIHLITAFEASLLTTNKFVFYLAGMTIVLISCLGLAYPLFNSEKLVWRAPTTSTVGKQYHPRRFGKLLQFEHLKKKRKKHVMITALLVLGILCGTSVFLNQQNQTLNEKTLKAIEELQNFYMKSQISWKLLEDEVSTGVESASHNDTEDATAEEQEENPYSVYVEETVQALETLEALKKKAESPNFPDLLNEVLEKLSTNTSYKEMDRSLWSVSVMATEEQRNILLEKGIKPWSLGDSWVSKFDDPRMAVSVEHAQVLKNTQERNTKYGNTGFFTIYKIFDWNIAWPVLGVFVLLLWTSMSTEQEPQSSIRFLITKPLRYRAIYSSKWVYNLIVAYGLLLICGVLAFVFSSLIGGIGEPDYPIVAYANSEYDSAFSLTLPSDGEMAEDIESDGMFYAYMNDAYFFFESLGSMILKALLLVGAQLFFLNGVFSFVGRWMKNQYMTIIAVIIVTIMGYLIANQFPEMPFSYLNPFLYLDTWNVVDGWKSIVTSSNYVNVMNGSLVLLASGFILFLAGLIQVRKKVS